MKKTISVEKVEANRANALKSTGPKTAEGKAITKMNSFKHGIFAREVVLRGRKDEERGREFHELHRLYRQHLMPVGPVEEMLVERIVTTSWRLHRVLIAERGEILRSLGEAEHRNQMSHPMSDPRRLLLTLGRFPWTHEAARELDAIRNCVRREGDLTEATEARLLKVLEGRSSTIKALQEIREAAPADTEGLSEEAIRAKRLERLSEFLDGQLVCCEEGLREIWELHGWNARVRRDASLMPAQEVVGKILRYEASLERQLYRAMNQLERLQRMRKGEDVRPPLVIQVT
jgi:hypothetical protein